MKNIALAFCVSLLTLTSLAAQASMDVNAILATYFDNIGGIDKWRSLKSMKMQGTMVMGPMEFPGIIIQQAPNKQHTTINIQGQKIVQAYDGNVAWWVNPFMSGPDPQIMPDEMAEEIKRQVFENELIDYAAKGHQLELAGEETIEGAACYSLKLTKKNGDVEFHFFDKDALVPIMIRTTIRTGDAQGQFVETYMSEYQEVEGLMFPHALETKFNGQPQQKISIQSIVLNESYPDTMFTYPGK